MDRGITLRFFFSQTERKKEEKFNSDVSNLYISVKDTAAQKAAQDKYVKHYSKDLTIQTVMRITNMDINEVFDLNIVLCQRHLLAHHAQNAYNIEVQQYKPVISSKS